MTRVTLFAAALAVAACSSSTTTTGGGGPAEDAGSDASGSSSPCGPNGVYGTFHIQGMLGGTETICGLSLGSFQGATLTIAQGPASGATVTVTNSSMGHIDVSGCAATVSSCRVTASSCSGSTDKTATVSLDLSVTATTLSGTSQLGFNGCQAPGLSFNGTR